MNDGTPSNVNTNPDDREVTDQPEIQVTFVHVLLKFDSHVLFSAMMKVVSTTENSYWYIFIAGPVLIGVGR